MSNDTKPHNECNALEPGCAALTHRVELLEESIRRVMPYVRGLMSRLVVTEALALAIAKRLNDTELAAVMSTYLEAAKDYHGPKGEEPVPVLVENILQWEARMKMILPTAGTRN